MRLSHQRVLCYLPADCDPQLLPALSQICRTSGLRLREVNEKELGCPLGKLAGFSCPDAADVREGLVSPAEPLLILCGLSDKKTDELLRRLREAGLSSAFCKAALTQTNQQWNLPSLYQELCRERQAIEASQKTPPPASAP